EFVPVSGQSLIIRLTVPGGEHVFAYQKAVMVLTVRTIGIARARTKIGIANFVYNMRRLVQLTKAGPA
ncbi:hypothetical protein E1297_00275, partial [Roseibium sp. RKSG952]|nr:hypothetical protein [Roseibium sp. RKSG952]